EDSTSGDEFNNFEDTRSISDDELNDIESSNTEISVLRTKEVNNVITRLLQAVPEVTNHRPLIANAYTSINDSDNTSMNDESTSSDSDDFEVEIIRDYNLISSKNLNNTIKQLENKFKSDKYSKIEKARFYTMLSYLYLVERGRKRVEASTIIAEAARKSVYYAHYIYAWPTNYIQNGAILISKQGKHPKTWSFLWDDDILIQIKSFFQSNK
ncbi:16760_t:CDS:2, partial [Dentiscutata heterogama]